MFAWLFYRPQGPSHYILIPSLPDICSLSGRLSVSKSNTIC
jgi:hypothetical protein